MTVEPVERIGSSEEGAQYHGGQQNRPTSTTRGVAEVKSAGYVNGSYPAGRRTSPDANSHRGVCFLEPQALIAWLPKLTNESHTLEVETWQQKRCQIQGWMRVASAAAIDVFEI